MFGLDSIEILVVAVVALIAIGPNELPRVMRTVGQWVGRARGMAGHFRSGIDTMMREAELEEMEKKWREENERIMREHPLAPGAGDPPDYDHPSMAPPPYPELPPAEDADPRLPLGDENAATRPPQSEGSAS